MKPASFMGHLLAGVQTRPALPPLPQLHRPRRALDCPHLEDTTPGRDKEQPTGEPVRHGARTSPPVPPPPTGSTSTASPTAPSSSASDFSQPPPSAFWHVERHEYQETNSPPVKSGEVTKTLSTSAAARSKALRWPPAPGPLTARISLSPSPSRSPTPTRTPPAKRGSKAMKLASVEPSRPENALTCGPAPAPAPVTTSASPSPSRSPAATNTPPAKPP